MEILSLALEFSTCLLPTTRRRGLDLCPWRARVLLCVEESSRYQTRSLSLNLESLSTAPTPCHPPATFNHPATPIGCGKVRRPGMFMYDMSAMRRPMLAFVPLLDRLCFKAPCLPSHRRFR